MPRPLLATMLAVWLATTAHAQSVTCRDGTVLSGANASRMCVTHGGLPPGSPGDPYGHEGQSSPRQSADAPQPEQQSRTVPRDTPRQTDAAPGGGLGQVWVNTASKAYHCPGTQYYGRTKRGEYMTEAAAKAAGAHVAGGHACS